MILLGCQADYKTLARYVVIIGEITFFVEHGVSKVNNHGKSPIPNYMAEDRFLISPELRKIQKSSSIKASCSRQLTFDLNEPLHGDDDQGYLVAPCLDMVLYDPARTEGEPSHVVPLDKPVWEVENLTSCQADFYDHLFTFNLDDAQFHWEVNTNHFQNLAALTYNLCFESMREPIENLQQSNISVTQLRDKLAACSTSGPENECDDRSNVHLDEEERVTDQEVDMEVLNTVMDFPLQEEPSQFNEAEEMEVLNNNQFKCYDPDMSE